MLKNIFIHIFTDFIMHEFDISDKRSSPYLKLKNAMKAKLNNEAANMKRKATM